MKIINSLVCKLKSVFVHSQPNLHIHYSSINSGALLILRVIGLIYLTAFYIYDLTSLRSLTDKIIYLTDVGFFFTWLYFLTVVQAKLMNRICKNLDLYVEIIYQSVFPLQIFITIAYWTVIYPQDQYEPLFKNINWHGIPVLLLFIDFIFNSYRFIPQQYAALVILASIYMFCINLPYSVIVRPVYGTASDWVSWLTYVFIISALVVTAILYALCRLIYVKYKQQRINHGNICLTQQNEDQNNQVHNLDHINPNNNYD